MKTQVIQLDPHDDMISVRDKMTWVRTPRLLLVFPKRGGALARTLDLLLVQRHATSLGLVIGLVTPSAEVRQRAHELGIPVFSTALAAQKAEWPAAGQRFRLRRKGKRPDLRQMQEEVRPKFSSWMEHPAARLFFFSLPVLALLGMLAVFLPSATVNLSPAYEAQAITINLSANPELASASVAEGLPARTASVALKAEKTIPISTRATVPNAYAAGTARFENLTLAVVGIPAGTVIQTQDSPPIRFVTLEDRVIAAEVGRTMEIPVRAVDAGPEGNLPAGSLVVVAGTLGSSLSVTNPEPTIGGTNKVTTLPSEADRSRLRDSLLVELRQMAITQLTPTLEPGSLVLPGTVLPAAGVQEKFSPPAGETGGRLTLTITGEFEVQYVAASDLHALENAILDTSLPTGYASVPASLSESRVGEPITGADGITRWTVNLSRSIYPRIDTDLAAQLVQGRPPAEAAGILMKKFNLRAAPGMKITPSFWPWLPLTSLRISVILP